VSIRIGSNIAALQAQRQLAQSSNELSSVFERLASGQRINRASDDAAGLAIADRLGADRRLWGQSIANINDGISALAIADGALGQRSGILARLAELAEQSSNGTFSNVQRGSLNTEYQSLLREMSRIGESTSFNGINLFDPNSPINLQVGVNGGANSRIGLDGIDLGSSYWTINSSELFTVADWDQDGAVGGDDPGAFLSVNEKTTLDKLKATFGNNWPTTTVVDSEGNSRSVFIGAAAGATGVEFFSFTLGTGTDGQTYFGNRRNADQFLASFGSGGAGPITSLTSNITISDGLGAAGYLSNSLIADTSGTFTLDFRLIRLSDTSSGQASSLNLSSIDSAARARAALDTVNAEIQQLGAQRGKIGGGESRLQVALSLAAVARENSAAAEGRIRDADTAFESARLVRLQILQQVGATVLQQAAAQPQLALRLLQG